MVLKGAVQPNHIPVNSFELIVIGLAVPTIFLTEITGLDQETEKVDLPDRTVASGGNKKALEFTAMSFEHHTEELSALEAWRQEGVDPVTPTYKKTATLIKRGIEGQVLTRRALTGLWIPQRKDADLDVANEGDPAMVEWSFSADDVDTV